MHFKTHVPKLLFFLVVVTLFWVRGNIALDPDFGWQLRTGQLILTTGIPQHDPFSYTMPSYSWVYHEWLYETVIAALYPFIGNMGLSLLSALIVTLALFLPIAKQNWHIAKILLLPAITILLPLSGVRAQIITWLGCSILIYLFFNPHVWQRVRWVLPCLFLIWANMHGGFVLGIVLLFFSILSRSIQKTSIDYQDILIFVLSSLITLVNPFGVRLWTEALGITSSLTVSWTIAEWVPGVIFFNFSWFFLGLCSVILVLAFRKQLSFLQQGVYCFLLLAALSAIKHIPVFVLFILPLLGEILVQLQEQAKRQAVPEKRLYKAFFLFSIIVGICSLGQGVLDFQDALILSEPTFYPKQAVFYLQRTSQQRKIFSLYTWNGYILWKLPKDKIFVDGRMPTWHVNTPIPGESQNAFQEYEAIITGKQALGPAIKKYGIDTILLPAQAHSHTPASHNAGIISFSTSTKDMFETLHQEIHILGWKKVYEDAKTVIYEPPSKNYFALEQN